MNHSSLYIYSLLLIFGFNVNIKNNIQSNKDSISVWLKYSTNQTLTSIERKVYLKKTLDNVLNEKHDSIRNSYLLKISFQYYKMNDSSAFREVNKKSIHLSNKLNDSLSLAANYWDLGYFFKKQGVKDSAYYSFSKAQRIYERIRNDFNSGTMLLNMAVVQSDIKDYTGSEITTIRAISKLKPLKKYRQLYRCYNNLAINFNNLEEYDKAIENHKIALEYQKKIKRQNTFKESTLNNIGVVFKNKNEHQRAIANYEIALETTNLKKRNIKLYAMLLDNMAYSKFKLNDLVNTKEQLFESLRIRDSIDDFMGIAINKLHLAEYYAFIKDSTKAKQYALEASILARNTKNYRELLPSLLFLSKLDTKNSALFTNSYIKLNDSLQKQERAIRNKFARIQFQTNEFIVKNKQLNKQKEIILVISGLLLLFGILLFVIRNERQKNKALLSEKEQQKANEQIYNLMIAQHDKLEEGSKKAEKRISEELHDGVLGKLFGTRLILSNLNSSSDKEAMLKREKYISGLQKIEEEVRNVSHELNSKSRISNSSIGYTKMIETLIEDQSKITNFKFEFRNDEAIRWKEKEGVLKMNLYRILQEAIQNINKYANAKNVLIEFETNENVLFMSIKDDGKGFNQLVKSNGIGLNNIKSRVKKVGGKVDIISSLNNGTSIKITIPNS